jgi:hypothetical protein
MTEGGGVNRIPLLLGFRRRGEMRGKRKNKKRNERKGNGKEEILRRNLVKLPPLPL